MYKKKVEKDTSATLKKRTTTFKGERNLENFYLLIFISKKRNSKKKE